MFLIKELENLSAGLSALKWSTEEELEPQGNNMIKIVRVTKKATWKGASDNLYLFEGQKYDGKTEKDHQD